MVHLAPALVGPPPAGVVLRLRRDDRGRDRARPLRGLRRPDLRREEDVLDTWFSSALWPFATLGWPEETPELRAFYPGHVNSTAREIIFLWVARMIMAGLELMGDIPFEDVIIHSTVLAPDGRRMSKSLGTGIDPLEVIDAHGADATRYGLCKMSSTQDVRFSIGTIEEGRRLANKLWNVSRLILGTPAARARPAPARADRALDPVARIERCEPRSSGSPLRPSLRGGVERLYHLTFDDFCDWYAEAIKPRLYEKDEDAPATAAYASSACSPCSTRSCRTSPRRSGTHLPTGRGD